MAGMEEASMAESKIGLSSIQKAGLGGIPVVGKRVLAFKRRKVKASSILQEIAQKVCVCVVGVSDLQECKMGWMWSAEKGKIRERSRTGESRQRGSVLEAEKGSASLGEEEDMCFEDCPTAGSEGGRLFRGQDEGMDEMVDVRAVKEQIAVVETAFGQNSDSGSAEMKGDGGDVNMAHLEEGGKKDGYHPIPERGAPSSLGYLADLQNQGNLANTSLSSKVQ